MPSDPQGTIVTFDDLEPNTVVTFDDAPMAQPSQPAQSFAVEGPPRPQFPLPTAMGAYEFLRTGGGDAAKRQLELESQALGSSIQIGEAPFAARAKAAFGMESSKPLEQLMPGPSKAKVHSRASNCTVARTRLIRGQRLITRTLLPGRTLALPLVALLLQRLAALVCPF